MCNKTKPLINSHIIPKAVIKWLKDTSATGYLRSAAKPDKRIQDGIKHYLMCESCDGGLIGQREKYFMEDVFLPYHSDKRNTIIYDARLHYFAASLAFRIILLEESIHADRDNISFTDLAKAKIYLKRYLLDLTNKKEGIEHYILLTDNIENFTFLREDDDNLYVERGLPRGMAYRFLRGVDTFALRAEGYLMTMALMPGFIFYTVIKPKRYRKNLGNKINILGGEVSFSESKLISHDLFGTHQSRAERINNISMDEVQAKKLEDSIIKNPQRWEGSETKKLIHTLEKKIPFKLPQDDI